MLFLQQDPQFTITQIAQAIRQRETSCVKVLATCVEKIDAHESQLHAWAYVDRETASQQARQLDDELAAGENRGLLHGIPIGIKDIIDVKNMPTGAGADWRKNMIAKTDAPLVKQLRDAGAILLGKTVTTQFACFDPPVTCNPWDITKTPGGSSSGSAVVVATGMCLGAIGTQTGGSITRPASFCGVSGCKPTFGKIDMTGIVPVSSRLDHAGVIARTVDDLWLMCDVLIASNSERDRSPKAKMIVGVPQELLTEKIESNMMNIFRDCVDRLSNSEVIVCEVSLPESFEELFDYHWNIMAHDAARYHTPFLKNHADDYLPGMRKLIEQGVSVSEEQYQQAVEHQQQLKQEIQSCFDHCDILATPATLGAVPDRATTGDPRMNTPWSYLSLPTISFPMNRNTNEMPLAIQLIGQANQEEELFHIARQIESLV